MSLSKYVAICAVIALGAGSAYGQSNYLKDTGIFGNVANTDLPTMPANTLKCNNTALAAQPADCTFPSVATQVESSINAQYNYITDFGGVAGGVTDNFLTLRAACNASGGARLYIPAGTYAVTVPAVTTLCTVPANTVIEGAGKGVTVLNLTVSDTSYATVFLLANANVVFKNLTINVITNSTVLTTIFGLQANNVRFENCSFIGNSVEGVRVGGTSTNLDTVNIIFASTALVGTPITITFTVTTGLTTAQIASGLVNAVNANATLTAAGITATLDGSFVKINQIDTLIPQASYTTSVTGAATETLTIGPSSGLNLVTIGGTQADDFSMLNDDVTSFSYVVLKANATTTTNNRFTFRGGFYNKNITGAFNINSPSGTFNGVLIEGTTIGSVGINNANDLPIALSHVTDGRIIGNYLYGTYNQNAMHFEEGANDLIVSGNVVEMATATALGAVYGGTCMYFVDNNIGGAGFRPVNNVTIANNVCTASTANESGFAIWQASVSLASQRWAITGNVFSGFANGVRTDVINGMTMTGNYISNNAASGNGIVLGAGVTYAMVSQNMIRTYLTGLTTAATLSVIRDNYGYNPVGAATVTPGASPWTYTAGSSPEDHYVRGGTVSSITTGGQSIATTSGLTIHLEPNESYVVTYTVAPAVTKSVH
jgi:hypothetical protein